MLVWVLILCTLIFIFSDTNSYERITILGYSPKYFYVSNGESNKMFEKMKNNGVTDESLKYFVMKEDKLLELEVKSVCSQVSRKLDAFSISDKIKNHFLGYDFSYHTKHLKQISEPEKIINQNIKCS
tara:strand:- start:12 stop:392 length:381 start_codon:yes stop_codon:yes gene_type:complete